MKKQLIKEDISKIKNSILFNIEDGTFECIKKYLIKNLSDYKKTDFIGELESKGIYMCGDNAVTTLSISKDKVTFSLTGEIQLTSDTDVIRFYNQFDNEETASTNSKKLKYGEKNNEAAKETLKQLLCNGTLACECTSLEERANEIARSIKGAFALLDEY